MSLFADLRRCGRWSLTTHLHQLGDSLQELADRLRDSLSHTLSQTVAGVLRQLLRELLSATPAGTPPSASVRAWPDADEPDWFADEEPSEPPWPSREPAEAWDPEEPSPEQAAGVRPGPALWFGCRSALAWLLRRPPAEALVLAAGIGLLSAAACYAGGPLASAGLAAFRAGQTLLSLAELVAAVQAVLGRWC